jgi:hypothetical protein
VNMMFAVLASVLACVSNLKTEPASTTSGNTIFVCCTFAKTSVTQPIEPNVAPLAKHHADTREVRARRVAVTATDGTLRAPAPQPLGSDDGWTRVRTIPSGGELIVTVRNGGRERRRFQSATWTDLTTTDAVGSVASMAVTPRETVLQIATAKTGLGGHKVGWIAVGAVGGLFAGYQTGYDRARGTEGVYRAWVLGMPAGAAIGAVVGAFAAGHAERIIYDAQAVSAK